MAQWHARSAAEALREAGADPERGLSDGEVSPRRARHGWNELPEPPPEPACRRLAAFALAFGEGDADRARTATFFVLALSQVFASFAARSLDRTCLGVGPLTNPALLAAVGGSIALQLGVAALPFARRAFGVTELRAVEWLWVGGLSLLPFVLIESGKPAGRAGSPRRP